MIWRAALIHAAQLVHKYANQQAARFDDSDAAKAAAWNMRAGAHLILEELGMKWPDIFPTIDDARFAALMKDDALSLTQEEIATGWHFCPEFDGLLIGPETPELDDVCLCRPENALPDNDPLIKKLVSEGRGPAWFQRRLSLRYEEAADLCIRHGYTGPGRVAIESAALCDRLAQMMECGAGEDYPGHRLRQAARMILAGEFDELA